MGLPRPNFARLTERLSTIRVPERLRSIHVPDAISNRVNFSSGLSAAGGLTLPYKFAVVAVMMLVAGGTLVTFGNASAETATVSPVDGSTATAAVGSTLPGTSEATPRVEGQVLPETTYDFTPDTSILSADDLLASLKLTDYTTDSDDKSDDDDDNKKNDDDNKNSSSNGKSGTKTGTKTGTKSGSKDDDKSDDGDSDNGGSDNGGSDDHGDDDGGSDDHGDDDGDDDGDDKSDDDDRKCKDAKSELVRKLCK